MAQNKNLESARAREKDKADARQRLLDQLQAQDGKAFDVQTLVTKYHIECWVSGKHGDVYEKTEEELRKDIEERLEKERRKAWLAANQAECRLVDPVARTLLSAEGRFPGKEAVLDMIQRWRVPDKVAFHRKGWIVFSFANQKDLEKVWDKGPQSIFGIPLILEPTPEDFDFNMKLKIDIPFGSGSLIFP